jgi:hypothetical protein
MVDLLARRVDGVAVIIARGVAPRLRVSGTGPPTIIDAARHPTPSSEFSSTR